MTPPAPQTLLHTDPTDTDAFRVEALTVRRGTTTILDGLSLHAPRGRVTALLGPNGCGKTTLSRALTGHAFAAEGTVTVLGQTLGRTDIRALRRRIGVVNPTTDSFDTHTPGAVVDATLSATDAACTGYFATVGLYDRPTDSQRDHARQLLRAVGLEHRLDHRVAVLSTGEQRRVLIARALVTRPELLILDEPTAGLDIAGREQVLATIEQLVSAENPPAVLMITHHVEELSPRTDRVWLMKQGRIVSQGAPHETITPETLSDVFGCKVFVRNIQGRYWLEVLPEAWVNLTKPPGHNG